MSTQGSSEPAQAAQGGGGLPAKYRHLARNSGFSSSYVDSLSFQAILYKEEVEEALGTDLSAFLSNDGDLCTTQK